MKQLRPYGQTSIEPVQPGDFSNMMPEYGRWRDVRRVYAIGRGSAYNLLADGKIKGVLLRVRGQKSGIRLFDMASVREYIRQCGAEQKAA